MVGAGAGAEIKDKGGAGVGAEKKIILAPQHWNPANLKVFLCEMCGLYAMQRTLCSNEFYYS